MDHYHHQLLNRDLFDPVFVVLGDKEDGPTYADDFTYLYTGTDDRFGALLKLFSTADIVLFSNLFSPIVCEAAITAGVPVLIELAHDVETGQLYDEIDLTICVSQAVKNAQTDPLRTKVIYNGIDVSLFRPPDQPRGDGKIVILQVGNKVKAEINLDELADDLLPLDSRIEMWIAGQEGESSERVKFLGMRRDIEEVYRQADILILLSKKEAFGLAAVEAMACGVIPIATDCGGPAEIVTHGVNGWIVPLGDRAGAVARISEAVGLLGSPKWEDMRRAARREVEDRFSIGTSIREYEKTYLDLVAQKGVRATAGPVYGKAPPEAVLEDAIFFMGSGWWDRTLLAIDAMTGDPRPVRIKLCAWAAERLAAHAIARDRPDSAEKIYKKLYASGWVGKEWMTNWLAIGPADEDKKSILETLLKLDPKDPLFYMLTAETAINHGDFTGALSVLERGATACPDNAEIVGVHAMLKTRLGM